ncbi:hypothetical protein [Kitasatospora sp. NPDC101183]|uniref:hypothetical protein n=1 Tax=Kitasatospora sp. NPDC101183 TaxID=3364100 RepID=UPI0038034894
MHVIRLQLRAPDGGPHERRTPAPGAVCDGLERALPGPDRIDHARVLTGPGTVDAVLFVLAPGVLAAEAAVGAACGELTGPLGALPGWSVPHCALDSRLALGLYELPSPL